MSSAGRLLSAWVPEPDLGAQMNGQPPQFAMFSASRAWRRIPLERAVFRRVERFRPAPENRGVPGSSPGLATRKPAWLRDLLLLGPRRRGDQRVLDWVPGARVLRVRDRKPSTDQRSGLVRDEVTTISVVVETPGAHRDRRSTWASRPLSATRSTGALRSTSSVTTPTPSSSALVAAADRKKEMAHRPIP